MKILGVEKQQTLIIEDSVYGLQSAIASGANVMRLSLPQMSR